MSSYDNPFEFNPSRLSRTSVRKALKKRALFEFRQSVGFKISRKKPEALLESFLTKFDRSNALDKLLALGREHREQILQTLLALIGYFNDPEVPEDLL